MGSGLFLFLTDGLNQEMGRKQRGRTSELTPTADDAGDEPIFFEVAPRKMAVMFVVTFGVYGMFWGYQNWRRVKTKREWWIFPVLYGIFLPLTGYFLFSRIHAEARRRRIPLDWSPASAAVSYFLLALMGSLQPPFHLFVFTSVIPLMAVQAVASQINETVTGGAVRNDQFSKANMAIIFFGGYVVLSSLVENARRLMEMFG